jgi:hypothetical protein
MPRYICECELRDSRACHQNTESCSFKGIMPVSKDGLYSFLDENFEGDVNDVEDEEFMAETGLSHKGVFYFFCEYCDHPEDPLRVDYYIGSSERGVCVPII